MACGSVAKKTSMVSVCRWFVGYTKQRKIDEMLAALNCKVKRSKRKLSGAQKKVESLK